MLGGTGCRATDADLSALRGGRGCSSTSIFSFFSLLDTNFFTTGPYPFCIWSLLHIASYFLLLFPTWCLPSSLVLHYTGFCPFACRLFTVIIFFRVGFILLCRRFLCVLALSWATACRVFSTMRLEVLLLEPVVEWRWDPSVSIVGTYFCTAMTGGDEISSRRSYDMNALVQEWPRIQQWPRIVLVQQRSIWRGVNTCRKSVSSKEYAFFSLFIFHRVSVLSMTHANYLTNV